VLDLGKGSTPHRFNHCYTCETHGEILKGRHLFSCLDANVGEVISFLTLNIKRGIDKIPKLEVRKKLWKTAGRGDARENYVTGGQRKLV